METMTEEISPLERIFSDPVVQWRYNLLDEGIEKNKRLVADNLLLSLEEARGLLTGIIDPIYSISKKLSTSSIEESNQVWEFIPKLMDLFASDLESKKRKVLTFANQCVKSREASKELYKIFISEGYNIMRSKGVCGTIESLDTEHALPTDLLFKINDYQVEIRETANYQSKLQICREIDELKQSLFFKWLWSSIDKNEPVIRFLPQIEKHTKNDHFEQFPYLLALPNSGPERDLHRSLMHHPDGWNKNELLGTLYFEGREKTTIVYQPEEVQNAFGDAPEQALRALQQSFMKIKNEATADVIDILFHHWKRHKIAALNGRATITLRQICEYRGVLPKGPNLELHYQAMLDIRSIRLKANGVDASLFDWDSRNHSGTNEIAGKDVGFAFAPGFFLQFAEDNDIYFAPFLQSIWKLDPHRKLEAKRLARFLRGEWRLNPQCYLDSKSTLGRYKTWRDLLSEMAILPGKWPVAHVARNIKKIEDAVEELFDLEFLAECGIDIYHPEDRRFYDNLPPRGRLDAWLNLRVCFFPAADIRDKLAEISEKKRINRERDALALSNAKAKAKLKATNKQK